MDVKLQAKLHLITSALGPGVVNKGAVAVTCPKCSKDNPEKKKLIIQIDSGLHHCWVCELKGRSLRYTFKSYCPQFLEPLSRIYESGDYEIEKPVELKEKVELPEGFTPLGPAQGSIDRKPKVN